jgi:peptidyl-prolyl cis-trans isomerase A (cyclophilin A)
MKTTLFQSMSFVTSLALCSAGLGVVGSGCEHKSEKDNKQATPTKAPVAPANTGAPVAPPTPTAPAAAPTAATGPSDANAVVPPTAADLAVYTKDLGGSEGGKLMATIETTKGVLNCELFGDKAPMTVANFIGLATGKKPFKGKDGQMKRGVPFYDGLTFHRVIPGFMIQGGDPMGVGSGGPGYEFKQEIIPGEKHVPGVLSMANAGPNTNGSQFFVMEADYPSLDGGYNIFGKCAEVDVVKAITAMRGPGDKPTEPMVMKKVTISRK